VIVEEEESRRRRRKRRRTRRKRRKKRRRRRQGLYGISVNAGWACTGMCFSLSLPHSPPLPSPSLPRPARDACG